MEDAKALGKFVIASDLNVHREQLKDNAWFFDPNDEKKLANSIETFLSEPPKISELEYKKNIIEFGNQFSELIKLGLK